MFRQSAKFLAMSPVPFPSMPSPIRAVIFDWRGTLVTELTPRGWTTEALRRTGREHDDRAVTALLGDIRKGAGEPNRLKDPRGNISYQAHRETYYSVFAAAALPDDLADALWDVDSDPSYNVFAVDVEETLRALVGKGCKVGVLSNIHFDIRPEFAAAGLLELVEVFVLSGELGIQKPDPAIFRRGLELLGARPEETLMVGDRPGRDGVAVEVGMPTLLVPSLTDPGVRQLHTAVNAVAA